MGPPPHKVYVPPHPSPPITALSPCTCPPHMGGTSPPPYHQGLGKTLYHSRRSKGGQAIWGSMVPPLSQKVAMFYCNFGQDLSSTVGFQTRNPPLSLFLAFLAVVFEQFCSNII